jgi:hypothetical protein
MSERKDIIRAAMQARHAERWQILTSLEPETVDMPVYTQGAEAWTVRQIITYLADAERDLFDQILQAHREALAFLDIIDEEALDLRGHHPSGELMSAEATFHRMTDHRTEYAGDIRQAINR